MFFATNTLWSRSRYQTEDILKHLSPKTKPSRRSSIALQRFQKKGGARSGLVFFLKSLGCLRDLFSLPEGPLRARFEMTLLKIGYAGFEQSLWRQSLMRVGLSTRLSPLFIQVQLFWPKIAFCSKTKPSVIQVPLNHWDKLCKGYYLCPQMIS